MIKNRSLMIGVGIGIILGAVLLQLVNIGKGETMLTGMQLTPEQIQQAAQAQNMQIYTSDQKVYTREQWQELVKQEAEKKAAATKQNGEQSTTKEPESTDPTAPESPEQPDATSTPSSTTNSSNTSSSSVNTPSQPKTNAPSTPSTSQTTTSTDNKSNWFTVSSGQMLNDIAFNLKKEGLIKSQGEFINRASQLNVNKKLQVGSYQINAGEGYDEILRTLSGQSSP